jgi:hypothetical protein
MKNAVSMLNGMYTLIRNGLNSCDYGFGFSLYNNGTCGREITSWTTWPAGYYKSSVGFLDYLAEPDANTAQGIDIVGKLSDLLTCGRLSASSTKIITAAYDGRYLAEGAAMALRVALQLIVSTPEFHTTNLVESKSEQRESPAQPDSNGEGYKAIVYVHMFGGMDSFYMLAPHSSCGNLRTEYEEIRGTSASLDTGDMVNLDASSSDQPCDTFGLNNKLAGLKEIYDAGHGLFFANTGHLTKPVTKYK